MLQGFEATIIAEKEFGYEFVPSELVTPQEDFKKVCVTLAGGGWLKVCGVEPSLKVTVYVVPGGLFVVPVIGKVRELELQMSVLPGFPKETAGLEPTKTKYFLIVLHPLFPCIV
jgi:hypothetical protein